MITLKHTVFIIVIKDVRCVNVGTHSKLHYETRVYEVLTCMHMGSKLLFRTRSETRGLGRHSITPSSVLKSHEIMG